SSRYLAHHLDRGHGGPWARRPRRTHGPSLAWRSRRPRRTHGPWFTISTISTITSWRSRGTWFSLRSRFTFGSHRSWRTLGTWRPLKARKSSIPSGTTWSLRSRWTLKKTKFQSVKIEL